MKIEALFDPATYTLTYVVWDPDSRQAVIIDPVLDYDPLGSQTRTEALDRLLAFVAAEKLHVPWVLETHAHADHLTAAPALREKLGAKVAIGGAIVKVQSVFKDVFALPDDFPIDGRQFDRLLEDGDVLEVGALRIEVLHTPGHTPACVSYKIEDAVFTGDALFMEDYGTGRCDFPSGSATMLYRSVHERLYALPDETRVFVGHDYQPNGRPLRYQTTIGASKAENVQLRASTTEAEFVRFRETRDQTLNPPRLLYPSVQVNIDGGRLPEPDERGRRFLRIPLNAAKPTDAAGLPPSAPAQKAS